MNEFLRSLVGVSCTPLPERNMRALCWGPSLRLLCGDLLHILRLTL